MYFKSDYIQAFKKYLKFQNFKSENTIQAYSSDLFFLLEYCKKKHSNNLSKQIISDYINYIVENRAFSWRSQSRIISSIRSFGEFLYLKGITQNNLSEDLELPKKARDLPKAINHEVLKKIINDKDLDTDSEKLARIILIVFYATGLRISELIKLTVSDLEENQGKALKVRGKGNKTRLVPLGDTASEILANHLRKVRKDRRYINSDMHYIFPSVKKGKDGKYKHLSRQHVYKIIKSLGFKYGINITPHSLRHSFATELVKNKADLRTVQLMLGHSDLATTQIYTKIADEQAYNSLLSNHPLIKNNRS